eukprot:2822917-Pleurochrysis_carterae.AAC.1
MQVAAASLVYPLLALRALLRMLTELTVTPIVAAILTINPDFRETNNDTFPPPVAPQPAATTNRRRRGADAAPATALDANEAGEEDSLEHGGIDEATRAR